MDATTMTPPGCRRHDDGTPRFLAVRLGSRSAVAWVVAAVLLAVSLLPAAVDSKPVCRSGEFLSRGQCHQCTACPSYLIVRRPCMRDSDTLCGLLYDFEFPNIFDDSDAEHAAGEPGRRNRFRQPPTAIDVSVSSPSNTLDIHSHSSGRSYALYTYKPWRNGLFQMAVFDTDF